MYVPMRLMSAALATAERTFPPDPVPDRPASVAPATAPARVTRFLLLLRWIISYGTDLASTIHQRAARPDFKYFASRFRHADLALILARIRRGLMLAGALQAKLDDRAARGRDIAPVPVRFPTPRAPCSAQPRQPRAPRRTNIIDLPLDRLPTAEEIAEELRRRPLGAILADICRDLGLMPGDLTGAMWADLRDTVIEYGGNLVTLVFKGFKDSRRDSRAAPEFGGFHPAPPVTHAASPVLCTGPP